MEGTGGQPDLLPVPDPKFGFCNRDGLKLIVTIKNQGTANAGASSTRVDFSNGVSQTQPTPAIPAGGTVNVLFDIPPGCFSPDCFFRITADSGSVVTESDETNNTASGGCIG
jgi:subtilase family serine protease